MTQIVRAGLHDSGVPLVFCGGGCGEMLRLGEADIAIRAQMGWGAPVCPTCRLIAQMENVATALLDWNPQSALYRALDKYAKEIRDLERHNYPDKQNPWGYE